MEALTLQTTAGERKVGANPGPGDIHRPVHHSELLVVTEAKTRPNNTTPYDAGDLIGAAADVVYEFDIGAAGMTGGGMIVGARLLRRSTLSTATRFRAFVHDAAPATLANADGSAFPLLWANALSRRGWVDFAAPESGDVADASDMLDYVGILSNVQGIPIFPADGRVRLLLTCRDGWTAEALEEFALQLSLVI